MQQLGIPCYYCTGFAGESHAWNIVMPDGEFYNVIESEELLAQWYQEYQSDNYRQAYMENAMIDLGASSCEMEMEIEEL